MGCIIGIDFESDRETSVESAILFEEAFFDGIFVSGDDADEIVFEFGEALVDGVDGFFGEGVG
jgi:hypothetical protein